MGIIKKAMFVGFCVGTIGCSFVQTARENPLCSAITTTHTQKVVMETTALVLLQLNQQKLVGDKDLENARQIFLKWAIAEKALTDILVTWNDREQDNSEMLQKYSLVIADSSTLVIDLLTIYRKLRTEPLKTAVDETPSMLTHSTSSTSTQSNLIPTSQTRGTDSECNYSSEQIRTLLTPITWNTLK